MAAGSKHEILVERWGVELGVANGRGCRPTPFERR